MRRSDEGDHRLRLYWPVAWAVVAAWMGAVSGLTTAQGSASDPDSFAGRTEMNGISIQTYKNFEKKWRLVTVRFRKDTEEMRWTYANDLAWKALEAGSIRYPDGAVFAKIGIRTVPDPQFASSSVPRGARRYQFMVRDAQKFKATGGWGYALFDVNGKTFAEDPRSVEIACAACHKLVENRGQVFSQPFELAPFAKGAFLSQSSGFKKIEFEWVFVTALSAVIRSQLPAGTTRIRRVKNAELVDHVFQGALDELKPTLEREAFESRAPALFASRAGDRFSLVLQGPVNGCPKDRSFRSVMTTVSGEQPLFKADYCNP